MSRVLRLLGMTLGWCATAAWTQPAAPPPPATPAPPLFWLSGVTPSYIGVGFQDVDQGRMKALNLREERGVEITSVDPESPAGKAGLQVGDVILEYNGQRVESSASFIRLVRETPAGREVKLTLSRGGQPVTVALSTAPRRERFRIPRGGDDLRVEIPPFEAPDIRIVMPDAPRAYMSWRNGLLGVETEALEGGLAEFFGVKEGLLVRSVGPGTAAEKAGLKAGDVIIRIDNERVAKAGHITAYLRSNREKRTFTLTVVREKREISLPVTVEVPEAPERRPRGSRVSRKQ